MHPLSNSYIASWLKLGQEKLCPLVVYQPFLILIFLFDIFNDASKWKVKSSFYFCIFFVCFEISYSSRSQSWPGQAWWFRWLALADYIFKPHFTPYQKKPVSFFNRLSSLVQNYDKNKVCPLGVYQAFLILNFCLICLMKLQKEMSTIFSVPTNHF